MLERPGGSQVKKLVKIRRLQNKTEREKTVQRKLMKERRKAQSRSTCLRKELEMLKDQDLEHLRQALSSEVQFLQARRKSSQENEQR
ncbi:hypothetical protein ATANTOWER_003625 [Ataeniobius toweri]|uniref:BZIP domain-containing protein n=1 Tax=Ataeniobius toweri TaxID=208326 RepID=A0ABU7C0A6_9TELE|nr:hypothetical protein [Ataeniobius toweri]